MMTTPTFRARRRPEVIQATCEVERHFVRASLCKFHAGTNGTLKRRPAVPLVNDCTQSSGGGKKQQRDGPRGAAVGAKLIVRVVELEVPPSVRFALRSEARSRLRKKAHSVADRAPSGGVPQVLLRQPTQAPPTDQGFRGAVGSQAVRAPLPSRSPVRLPRSHQYHPSCARCGNGRPIDSSPARVPVPRCWDPRLAPRPPVAWTEHTGHRKSCGLGTCSNLGCLPKREPPPTAFQWKTPAFPAGSFTSS